MPLSLKICASEDYHSVVFTICSSMLESKAGFQGSFPGPRVPELDSRDSVVTDEK